MLIENEENIDNILIKLNINGYIINNVFKKVFNIIYKLNQDEHWNGKEYIDFVKKLNETVIDINNKIEILMNEIPNKIARLEYSNVKLYTASKLKKINCTKCTVGEYMYSENRVGAKISEIFCYFKEVKRILQDYEYYIKKIQEDMCIVNYYYDIRDLFYIAKSSIDDNIRNIRVNITTKSIICKQKKYELCKAKDKSLDIIIPAYNAKATLKRTLYSIASQKKINHIAINVYVVNDFSDYDYQEIINPFKNYFNIQELNTGKNMGPGFARQYGMDNSNQDYIVFMDSDDYFATPYSLQVLYKNIVESNSDLVISKFASEYNGNLQIKYSSFTWLHGKIFNRTFLEKNDIKFNNTRANEDCGFNFLVKYHNPVVKEIDYVTYIWSENMQSITRRNDFSYDYYGLEGFSYNITWAGNIALNKGLNTYEVTITTLRAMLSMWTAYSLYYNKYDVNQILSWTKSLKVIYDKNKKYFIDQSVLNWEIENKKKLNIEDRRDVVPVISFEDFLRRVDFANSI